MISRFRDYSATVLSLVLAGVLLTSVFQLSKQQRLTTDAVEASSQSILATSSFESQISETSLLYEDLHPRMAQTYEQGGESAPFSNIASRANLLRMNMTGEELWVAGIMLVPHDGLVEKTCEGLSGNIVVSGLAVKPNALYPSCPNGQEIIPSEYKNPNKCTVHYNASQSAKTSFRGSTAAVLAHEIGHCLYFIYGEDSGMQAAYQAIRPNTMKLADHQVNEIIADDFMICRYGLNTNWGSTSYYSRLDIVEPIPSQCQQLNTLFSAYYPL